MQSVLKVLTVWLCLCVGQTWFSQGSQLGQVVPDRTTDELFNNVGRVDVNFTVNGETVELDVVVEDTIGEKELWLIDFQPYRFQTTTPINPQTGYLSSSQTSQCSNIEKDQSWDNQYFDDSFFQSHNGSGEKHLFNRYLRGSDDRLLEIRLDEIRYAGEVDSLLKCERSDGINIWDYTISFEEIQYTTILYATNVRPVPGWTPGGSLHVPAVAYVQTHFKLVWRLSRIAIINFVISSVTEPTLSERLLKEIGRLIVTFEFAIVEPVLKSDGTPDLSRAHVQLGFSTKLPAKNQTMVVFRNGTETYEPDVQGNVLEEVISSPPYTLDDTPLCNLRRPEYCLQFWEFEMILKMDLSSLVQEKPLDATGVFQFNFDSYRCTDFMSNSGCTIVSDLPPWAVRIDLTLQTTVGVVDEETDTVSVSVVKLANGKGEDLRGGRTINHMENITLEVRITPAFLRNDYVLELQLFMVCIGDQHMQSSRGCLGASEDKRYSAYVGDDLSFDYDPMIDPDYLAMLQAQDASLADSEDQKTEIPSTPLPTYNVEKILSREYSIWDDVVTDSVFIRPYDPSLHAALGKPSLSLHFLQDQAPDDKGLASFYLLEPNINSTSNQSTIIADEHSFQEHFASGSYHILGTVLAWTKSSRDPNLEMVFSAFTKEPNIVSYVGTSNPNVLPCNEFVDEELYKYIYTPNWVDLSPEACTFLMDLLDLKVLVLEHVTQSSQSSSDLSLHRAQDVYLLPEILSLLHLHPSFFDRLVELGVNSDWGRVNHLLYATLLFQTKNVLDAFESDGLLSSLRNRVKFLADLAHGFNDHILQSVNYWSSSVHVSLTERLLYILNRTQNAANETTYSESLESLDDPDWATVYIDESFYHFLWEITFIGTSYYHGKTFTTHSQDPTVTLESNRCEGSQYLAGYWERCRIDWLEVIPFWTYILPHVTTVDALPGGWGFWSDWGECSLTCGGGTYWRYRECIDTETGCSGPSSQAGNCNEENCLPYDKDDFLLVFKATSNIGSSLYDLWVSSKYSPDYNNSLQLFKSSLVEEWNDIITIEEVKVVLLRDGHLILELVFDGQDSTKMDWFSEDRLKSSPYKDIKSERKNFFNIKGHEGLGRRFFISHKYNGCGHQIGWLGFLAMVV